MADEQFERDAKRMKSGMLTSPSAYRKMYAEDSKTAAPAKTTRDRRIDEAEAEALGIGNHPGPSMTDAARQRINSGN